MLQKKELNRHKKIHTTMIIVVDECKVQELYMLLIVYISYTSMQENGSYRTMAESFADQVWIKKNSISGSVK